MFLTDQEREKFASYLEQDASSNEQMANQMKSLPGAETLVPMIKIYVVRSAAERLIAGLLRSTESQKI